MMCKGEEISNKVQDALGEVNSSIKRVYESIRYKQLSPLEYSTFVKKESDSIISTASVKYGISEGHIRAILNGVKKISNTNE